VNDETPVPGSSDRIESRDRFLKEFLRAWLEGRDMKSLVEESARRLRAILEVDRLTVSFVRTAGEEVELVARATDSAPGVPPLPDSLRQVTADSSMLGLGSRTFWCEDVLEEPAFAAIHDSFRSAGTRAMLLVPIRIGKEPRGAVFATTLREHPRTFRPGEVAFLETAVAYLSAALRDAELLVQLSRERDRQRVLFDVAMTVQRATTVPELVQTVLSLLKEPLGFPIGIFGQLAPDGRTMEALGAYGGKIDGKRPLPPYPLWADERPSLAELAMASEEPIVVDDVASDPRVKSSRERIFAAGARRVAIVALRAAGRPLGALLVGSDDPRRFEADDIRTLRSLAGFVSVALEQRRSAEEAERATREARALSDASAALLIRTASRDVLLEQVLDALVRHFGQENCRLLLVEKGRHALVDVARRGDWSGSIPERVFSLDSPGLCAIAAREGVVLNVPDVKSDPRYLEGWLPARSELVVPLRIDDEVAGVIDMQSTRLAAFRPEDVRILTAFAERAALALRLADLVGTLEARTRSLEAVTRATRLLSFRFQAPDVLSALAEETSRAFPVADGCVVLVADPAGKKLSAAATFGDGRAILGLAGEAPQPVSALPCAGRAFAEDRPVFLSVSGVDELLAAHPPEVRVRVRAAIGGRDLRHLLALPIHVGERRLGVLEVIASGERAFDERDAEMLGLLADHAAIALRNARMVEELQRSNRLKDDFLANLSHEVRTPLTGIVGWSEVLLDARGNDPETRRALEAILGQSEILSRMLADLIDLSKMDNFGLELRRTRVSLADVTRSAIDAVAPSAAKRHVTILSEVSEELPHLEGDAGRLRQVVSNLLTNAVKFSPPGAAVRVLAQPEPDGGIEFSVEDHGYGIDPAFLPHVFERFRQEETSFNRRFGGLGIGLAIARAVVLAHDGTIAAISEGHDKGCRFVVRFPQERVTGPSGRFRRVGEDGAQPPGKPTPRGEPDAD
jgi:signal transduction histidine kinase